MVEYNHINLVMSNPAGSGKLFLHNQDYNSDYDDYPDYTQSYYITEMLHNPSDIYTMEALEGTLEKPFEQLSGSGNTGE